MNEDNRMDVKILGVVIGTASGWDDQDTCAVTFYDVELNDIGRKFFKSTSIAADESVPAIAVDFERGIVEVYINRDDETPEKVVVDWAVFNKG